MDGGAADVREPDDVSGLGGAKMLAPAIGARMKESREETGVRIEAREIGPLLAIADMTGQREVVRLVAAPVLLRYDVLNVKREIRMNFW